MVKVDDTAWVLFGMVQGRKFLPAESVDWEMQERVVVTVVVVCVEK